jgi:hypothetical protein
MHRHERVVLITTSHRAVPRAAHGRNRITSRSGTIAYVFPSMPQDGDRDPWGEDVSREIARGGGARSRAGLGDRSDRESSPDRPAPDEAEDEDELEIEVVPVRRSLSLAIAGFAALLGIGLILGAQTSGPDARTPYAIVIFGVQALFVLAWTMANRPPVPGAVAGIALATGLAADYLAVTTETPRIFPIIGVALGGIALIVVGEFILRVPRLRIRESIGTTVLIVSGVCAYATLIALTRKPVGTQAILVCLSAAAVALLAARLIDAFWPKPRIAPQVPRGATGVVVGAMLGTLLAALLGTRLVLPFTPGKGAVLGLIAAALAVLADLAVNFSEAGRNMAGQAPTFWLARHMQGPLGAFALTAPVAYAMTALYLT